ncbi:type II toxin-antitoxin system RelE/ParE family toxin [Sphingomonas panacis]|uniref:type II toxin-antitoxin system RelE/ParE family toxin n=1 Tax=Sphingomonas panacis TaxID=1560345 RepID=UPI001F0A3E61|nr:type II toxin-antitoxin system RelE/ParE family toxin [Sphingomonas panacis]
MKVRWTPEADRDRTAIWDYLAARDPNAALRIDQLFSDAVVGVADFPCSATKEKSPARAN